MSIRQKLRIIFAGLALGLFLLALLLGQSRVRQLENRTRVLHTQEVLAELGLLRASAIDGEVACRGYALSGDERYQKFGASAFAEAARHLESLSGLTRDNPRQSTRLLRLREVVHGRAEFCASLVNLRSTQGLAAAAQLFAGADAKGSTDRERTLLREVEQEERGLLLVRDAQMEASDRMLSRVAIAASGVAFGLLFSAYFLLNRESRRRQTLEQELRQSNQDLLDASRLKSEFLAHMSHELRTPLNAVIGYTGTLLMRLPGPLNAGQEKQLKTIQSSARHLLSLINDVLDVARIEAGKVDVDLTTLACQEVIEEVMATLRPLAQAKNLTLEAELPECPVSVRSDRRAFSQILINLGNNAIKFTENGTVRLRLHDDSGAGLAAIDVLDTGVGVKPEEKENLFRAFQQLNAGKRHGEGTGLGLYVCGRLAELIQGRIEFDSEYGKGSRFTLLIPKA